MKTPTRLAMAAALVLFTHGAALAQRAHVPDAAHGTTFSASVSEQATVTVPAAVAFDVRDVTQPTASDPASVEITAIALAPAYRLEVSLAPAADTFRSPSGATSWRSGAVRWNAPAGAAWTGTADALADAPGVYTRVASCDPGANACATSDLVFTLDPRANGTEAGQHTLTATWKFAAL